MNRDGASKCMAAISAGEFERIFKELYKPLCLFALRFTEKTEDAEDVVQQAFADIWDKNSHNVVIANLKSLSHFRQYGTVPYANRPIIRCVTGNRMHCRYGGPVGRGTDISVGTGCASLGGYRRAAYRTEEDIFVIQTGRIEISGDRGGIAYIR